LELFLTIIRQKKTGFVQMFLNILIITFILLCVAVAGMALSILVKKKGRFPAYRVGHNPNMHKMGIRCAKDEEIRCHNKKLQGKNCHGCQQPS
jgi:hypothetical protein